MVFPIAAALGAAGSLLGGLFQGQGAEKGGKMSAKATLKANTQNLRWQKRFAQHGIQWKVRDAARAGISPLAALGAQTQSFSPSFVGATQAGQGVADAAAAMGQGISRATTAFGSADDQNDEYLKQLQNLQLQNMALQNQALGSQIRLMTQPGTPPAAPVAADRYSLPGQGATVDYQPNKLVIADPDHPGFDPGTMNDVARVDGRNDTQVIVPGKDIKQAVEDTFIPETQMAIRQNLDIARNPEAFWKGKVDRRSERIDYNIFTGRLSKYKLPPGMEFSSDPYFHKNPALDTAGEYQRRREYMQRNAGF